MKLKILLFFILLPPFLGRAQEFPHSYFRAPLDIPLYLSGNFGELRSDHYHSGIDIKTQGRAGFKVFAAAEGFVSRIKVSPYGYGNALYITHPNGYTTVYGHLQRFSPKIDSVVKRYQYSKESFAIDEILPSDLIAIKKSEIIARSGNSGSSGGPHLHFEIRETDTEFPTNPLHYGFDIQDKVAPVMSSLVVYSLDDRIDNNVSKKQYDLLKEGDTYGIKGNEKPIVSGTFGLALDVQDYMSNTRNYYGVYKLELYVDGDIKHSFSFDKFSFAESRYINAHIDYELYKNKKRRVHKLFHEENQQESFAKIINRGILFLDDKEHYVKIKVEDTYGNKSRLEFKIKSMPKIDKNLTRSEDEILHCAQENRVEATKFFAQIPAMTLYRDIKRKEVFAKKSERVDSYSKVYHFMDETIPLHKKIKVGIVPVDLPEKLKKQAFVARKDDIKYHFVGNEWSDAFLIGKTKKVGGFVVLVDTVPPEISLWKGGSYKKTGKLRYKITDNLSGIVSYRGEIDGKWVLFEYDAKRNLLWHTLSAPKVRKGGKHELVLELKDACGNVAVRKAFFTW